MKNFDNKRMAGKFRARGEKGAHVRSAALACLASALITTALPARAQEPEAASDDRLEELVITARRSAENLQEVPLAITALSADTLEKAQVRQIRDIAMLTPGLSIGGDAAERGQQPSIRGLNFAGDQNGEGNVAVMLDGIYLANSGVMSMGLMDFERVEVVKGPQSALYGHNAFAGAINYVPKAPPSDWQAKVQLRAADHSSWAVLPSIGGPIIEDVLTFRLSGTIDKAGGAYKDVVNGKEIGGWDKKDVNLQLRYQPTEWATIDFGAYYGEDSFGRIPQAALENNCFANAAGAFTQFCGELPDPKTILSLVVAPNKEPNDLAANDREVKHARLRGVFELDAATVQVSAGYFDTFSRQFAELYGVRDGIPYQLVGTPAGTVNLAGFFGGDFQNKDQEAEIRVMSSKDKRLSWAVGAYTYNTKQDSLVDIGIDADPIPAGRTIVCPFNFACLWQTPGGSRTKAPGAVESENTQRSVFASAGFDVTDRLKISGEARYTWEEKFSNVLNVATTTGPAANPDGDGITAKFEFWNPRLTGSYEVSEDVLVYASAAKGTKSGGFNQRAILASELRFNPENNWTYEIGLKNTLFDRRLRLNVAAFYVDWTDLQAQVPSANPLNIGAVTQNFGSVEVFGGEIEASARVATGVLVNLGVAYTDPKFGSDSFDYANMALCASVPSCAPRVIPNAPSPRGPVSAVKLDGLLRNGVSQWQFTGGIDVNRPLVGDWGWFTAANYKYESKQYVQTDNLRWWPERQTLNLSAGVERGNLRLTAWAQNALDDLTVLGFNGGGITRYNTLAQVPKIGLPDRRRLGVTLDYTF